MQYCDLLIVVLQKSLNDLSGGIACLPGDMVVLKVSPAMVE